MKKKISLYQSFGHALTGLYRLLATERNSQIHLGCALITIALGIYCQLSTMEWMLVTACISGVLSMEALNTAIELCVDLVSPQWHALAKDAKDIAAGAVLIVSIGATFIGAAIFLPKLLILFMR